MKQIKKVYFTVFDAIFQQKIHILLNYTPEDFAQWLNKNKIKDISVKDFANFAGWASDFITEKETTERIIFLPKFQWTIKHQGTLIHEITHVIIKIWQFNNIPFNADTQEFLAHSIANLYEDIASEIFKKTKGKEGEK